MVMSVTEMVKAALVVARHVGKEWVCGDCGNRLPHGPPVRCNICGWYYTE